MGKSVAARDRLLLETNKRLGGEFAFRGTYVQRADPIPTGILSLDYKLGTGGWPRGHLIGIYGPRDLGKSTVISMNAAREAQKMGLNVGVVATEPHWGGEGGDWARKHGVDPDEVLIIRPDTAEKAFDSMYWMLTNDILTMDLIVFDSVGALLSETEVYGTQSGDAKPKAGGQSGIITWGVNRLLYPLWKTNATVLMLNQVRDNFDSRYGGYMQKGGHALEHDESIIIKLGRGQEKKAVKVDGDEVQIMHEIIAKIERNKCSEGSSQTARFKFYNKEVPGEPFGVDVVDDVINTAKRLGVIADETWVTLPGTEKKINGIPGVREYVQEHPEVLAKIRDEVLVKMKEWQEQLRKEREAAAKNGQNGFRKEKES